MNRLLTGFRFTALGVCAISALFSAVENFYRKPGGPAGSLLEAVIAFAGAPRALATACSVLLIIAFAVLFWISTKRENLFRASEVAVAMLAGQAAIAAASSIELLLLVAIEVAFVFPLRQALAWVAAQSALLVFAVWAQVALTGTHPLMSLFDVRDGGVWVAMSLMAVSSAVWHFLSLGLGFLAANAERQAVELRRVNAELRATQQVQAETARLAERLSISRELHDSSGHHLAALSINLRLMRRISDRGELAEKTDECLLIARQLLADVREAVRDLRDIPPVDLKAAIETMAEGVASLKVHVRIDEDLAAGKPFHAHALFRCCQEVLTNAVRHSGARNLWIEVAATADGLRLSARDDGEGTSRLAFGNGLRGMEERAMELGGRFEAHGRRGEGFQVSVLLPVKELAG